jgi:hypothetical protein
LFPCQRLGERIGRYPTVQAEAPNEKSNHAAALICLLSRCRVVKRDTQENV